jgi:hypothetical protein
MPHQIFVISSNLDLSSPTLPDPLHPLEAHRQMCACARWAHDLGCAWMRLDAQLMRWSRSAVTRACPHIATISFRCSRPLARQVAVILSSRTPTSMTSQVIDAISRTDEGDMGHSILQQDMPDDENYHCEPSNRGKLRYSASAWLSRFHLTSSWPVAQRRSAWTSWLCQYLGVLIPQLMQLAGRQDEARSDQQGDKPPPPFICPYNWHVIDTHGDHMHTCKKHIGNDLGCAGEDLSCLGPVHTEPQHTIGCARPPARPVAAILSSRTTTSVELGTRSLTLPASTSSAATT